jgi:hypothetical protein
VLLVHSVDDEQRYAVKRMVHPYPGPKARKRAHWEVQALEMLPPHPNLLRFLMAWEQEVFSL